MVNKFFLLLTVFLITPASAFAQWQTETFINPTTQQQSRSATVQNEDGFELAVFRTAEGTIWMDFMLSDNTLDQLSLNQLPKFQIDDQKPVQMLRGFTATIVPAEEGIEAIIVEDSGTVSTERDFSVNHIIAERLPERVICPIWQGDDRPHLNTIEALANGHHIKFDYVLLDDTTGQTTFSLQGAKQALDNALNQ